MGALVSKPGLTSASVLSIPKDWSAQWFRNLIANLLTGADVRNAVGVNGIQVSGNITSPYAKIGFAPPITLPGPVTISSAASGTTLTIDASSSDTSAVDIVTGSGSEVALRIIRSDLSNNAIAFFQNGSEQLVITGDPGSFSELILAATSGNPTFELTGTGAYSSIINLNAAGGGSGFIELNGSNTLVFPTTGGVTVSGRLGISGNSPPAQVTGFGTPTGQSVIANFPGATASLVQTSETVAEILTILKGMGIIGA